MPTIKVVDVIRRAATILQDSGHVRWSKDELLTYFNDAQIAIVNRRPDAYTHNTNFPVELGTKQNLPHDGLRLMRVVRNTNGMAIREITSEILDNQIPNWHDRPTASNTQVEFFVYDERDPKTFYLYPAPNDGHSIELVYARTPELIEIADWETTTDLITLDDCYVNPILDWILYRAYSKDSDSSPNAQRALMHFESFRTGIGEKSQADVAASSRASVPR